MIPDSTRQKPIPNSLNTDDIPSLHQWGTEGLPDTTSATGSRGPTDPAIRITSGFVTRSQRRKTGSVQTSLFGGTSKDPAVGFRHRVKELAAEQAEQVEEIWSSSEAEEDPVDDEDDEDDEEEDEEEEEDLGSSDAYGSGDEKEDEDSPPASAHRPISRSTPKKSVSRPKRKAF